MNINSKTGRKISFSYATKASISFTQWGECVYGVQSLKEMRLLHQSMTIPIDEWTLILKDGGNWSFSYKTKAPIRLFQ